jgi:hypothetical protein
MAQLSTRSSEIPHSMAMMRSMAMCIRAWFRAANSTLGVH